MKGVGNVLCLGVASDENDFHENASMVSLSVPEASLIRGAYLQMLQSKATSYRHGSTSRTDEGFYWFFICQECRRDARRLDPWYTVIVEKKEK